MSSYNSLINSTTPVLVDFTAAWCGPCQTMAPELKKVASEFDEKVKIIKIDIDKNQELANKLQIRSVPTLILYKDGQPVWRQSGAMMAGQIRSVLASYI